MTENVVYGEVPGSASEALDTILKNRISGMPIVKRGTKELIGVVTRRDFSRHPEESQLAILMTRDVTTIRPNADIKEAASIFLKNKFRRLPVVENSELLGIVTTSDIVWRAIARAKVDGSINGHIDRHVTAVFEETPLKVTYDIMRLSRSRALPVLDSAGKLVGIIADTDLLKVSMLKEETKKSEMSAGTEGDAWGWDSKNVIYITKKKLEVPDIPVKECMVKSVVTATRKTSVSDCAKKMAKSRVEQIPIINAEGNIIGLIKDVDLLKAV
jgi:CBS domain-containing protein